GGGAGGGPGSGGAPDGGGRAGSGGGTGAGGVTGTGGGGGGRAGGFAGSGTCPTTFGNIAYGDSNPLFTSGIAVLDASKIYIFTMATGAPLPTDGGAADAAAPTGNLVYAQAFDAA